MRRRRHIAETSCRWTDSAATHFLDNRRVPAAREINPDITAPSPNADGAGGVGCRHAFSLGDLVQGLCLPVSSWRFQVSARIGAALSAGSVAR